MSRSAEQQEAEAEDATPPRVPRVPKHPGASSPEVSRRMSRAKRRDTAPEIELRRLLHRAGLRYRVAYPVPGNRRRTIDIAFPGIKLAVFVDGCFWHGCPEHGTMPRANGGWWATKLAANQERDRETRELLESDGWAVVRVWEHEPVGVAAANIKVLVAASRTARTN